MTLSFGLVCLSSSQNSGDRFAYEVTGVNYKNVTQRQPDGRDAQDKVWRRGTPPSPKRHAITLPEALPGAPFWILTEAL